MPTMIVVAGDSNAVGYGSYAAPMPVPNTYIFDGMFWNDYIPGMNSGTPNNPQAWGPEYQIAVDFHKANPGEPLFIIKSAKGSTPLADIDGLDWNVNSRDEMFDFTTMKIDAARAMYQNTYGARAPDISATFFISGPNDSFDPIRADVYQTNETALFAGIRDAWMDDPNGHIIFNRMTEVGPYNFTVRVAQWNVDQVDVYAESFKTIGYDMMADGIHYSDIGRIQLGHGFYDTWIF